MQEPNPTLQTATSDRPLESLSDDERFPAEEGWHKTKNGWVKVYGKGGGRPQDTTGDRLWSDRTNRGMDIAPEQATPDRIAWENEQAKRHGTGAVYGPDGKYHNTSRRGEAREMRRRGMQNNDGGANDYTGPSRDESRFNEYYRELRERFG